MASVPARRKGPSPARHLARVAGIEIQFHNSWLIILALFLFTFATGFAAVEPHWSRVEVGLAALATTLLFFVSVVLHEFAHSMVARAGGLPVHGITLFIFGGVSQLEREPDDAASEFRIAIAGPLCGVVLGGICMGVARLGNSTNPFFAVAQWLGIINVYLAIFNLVPGFPLDGGRVLRAIIWSANHDLVRATRWAVRVGKGCAIALIVVGLGVFFVPGESLSGLWLAFIGWFLLTAADQSGKQTEMRAALDHYTVRDLESPVFATVEPERSLESYIQELAAQHQYRASFVVDGARHLLGVISPADLNAVPREAWSRLQVADRMVPQDRVSTVGSRDDLFAALEKMMAQGVAQLPVIDNGCVAGVIRRDRILELVHQHLVPAHG